MYPKGYPLVVSGRFTREEVAARWRFLDPDAVEQFHVQQAWERAYARAGARLAELHANNVCSFCGAQGAGYDAVSASVVCITHLVP